MIAQVVFDLPVEGPFDYSIPSNLEAQISLGSRVQIFLGTKKRIGIVTALLETSAFESLKPIKSIIDEPLLDQAQMALGSQLSRYYGCSLGEALFTIARGCETSDAGVQFIKAPTQKGAMNHAPALHWISSGNYESILISLINPLTKENKRTLLLVPDQFAALSIEHILKKHFQKQNYSIGTRSSVFQSFANVALVIMIDEDDPSFQQEQTPMYETRDVLLMRKEIESIDIAFVSVAPSVELLYMIEQNKINKKEYPKDKLAKIQTIDLNTYKFTPKGLLSIPIKNAIEQNLAKKEKTVLVLNRKGSYAVTRCVDCGFVLKCQHCDSAMSYSRLQGKYLCQHCSFTLNQEINCPQCNLPAGKAGKPSWKSIGIGVEQLQKELNNLFPLAKVACFERGTEEIKDFDILIATQAVLRFKYQSKANTVGLIDLDNQLNRMNMHSSFRAWSLVQHLRTMAKSQVFIQTRNRDHYVIKSLLADDPKIFYDEDMNIRREFKLSPFGHEASIVLRSKSQTAAQKITDELYSQLKNVAAHPPSVDAISKKRDQYRFNILVRGDDVIAMIATIKAALLKVKRSGKVIVTINVDP